MPCQRTRGVRWHGIQSQAVTCEVEYTDEFEEWWNNLSEEEQDLIAASVGLLEERGAQLPYPHGSGIKTSCHSHMRELRIQHKG